MTEEKSMLQKEQDKLNHQTETENDNEQDTTDIKVKKKNRHLEDSIKL